MAKEKNWESLFPGIRKSVQAAKFPEGTSEDEKDQVFSELIRVLLNKSVYKPDGTVYNWRSGCVDYLMDVLPKLEEEEIHLILVNKEAFYKKFCFSPSKKFKSLYSELKFRNASERLGTLLVQDLYDRYSAELGLSPYELPEEETVVTSFLDCLVDDGSYFFGD